MPTIQRMLWCLLFSTLCGSIFQDAAPLSGEEPPQKEVGETNAKREDTPRFEMDVAPILRGKCVKCHNETSAKAELDLSSFAGLLKGAESGEVVVPGKAEESILYEMIHEGQMPPGEKDLLSESEIDTIRDWINAGAKAESVVAQTETPVTNHDVQPILYLRCTACHGLRLQEAGLDLRSRESILKGGKSGPAMVLGKPDESLLLQRIHKEEMPPRELLVDFGVRPMESSELATLTRWIAEGAPEVTIEPDVATAEADPIVTDEDRQFWSFQTPTRAPVPPVQATARVRNPIDAFVLAKLETKGLPLSPEADRLTLIRRVAFDLTGLPPAWDYVYAFLADETPDAYEKMVDRFLASPQYGERWGRYWLDLAGYADSEGKRSADPIRPHAWRYRDYVVRAFNHDKPFDRFLMEQIAGDELANYEAGPVTPEIMDNLIATGFLRMAPDGTGSDVVNTVVERLEVISDEIDVFGSAVLGLTMKCARCHSHKYDPIPQRDYYRLAAVFKGAYDEHDWLKPSFVPGQTKVQKPGRELAFVTPEIQADWEKVKAEFDSKIARLKSELETAETAARENELATRLGKLPEELHEDLRVMLSTPASKRNEIHKYLASKFETKLKIDRKVLEAANADFKKLVAETDKKTKALNAQIPPAPRIRALWDRGEPSPTYMYRRGEYTNPGRLVGPGVPSVLTDGKTPFTAVPPWEGAKSTGNRLALAKWLVAPEHPLTARVMVNRIWAHHFGTGIVSTTDNFGRTGAFPTHPELLDWLAREFIEKGWSIKEMHRLMLNSSTYRQTSAVTPDHERVDPENQLLARMPLSRLDAESLRDTLVQVAGKLDAEQFGPPAPVSVRADGLVTSQPAANGWRRSIYVMQRRKEIPTILENFDLPQMAPNCVDRTESTVASQALHLLNDSLVRNLSRNFAERVQREAGDSLAGQVRYVYQVALSRPPTDEERRLGEDVVSQLTAQWQTELGKQPDAAKTGEALPLQQEAPLRALANYCHMILNSAAFLYVD